MSTTPTPHDVEVLAERELHTYLPPELLVQDVVAILGKPLTDPGRVGSHGGHFFYLSWNDNDEPCLATTADVPPATAEAAMHMLRQAGWQVNPRGSH